ncbi:cyclic lactone autoinducer peptide [Bacillus aquiflavi]|uniref:Cyclic lactone autoinducer peptide n=1 Tax=Bacillus aquiflavi TaxID=2672567 RepID=A0A6B3W524_9BACI|nr:cyclic lactone autoinducer peptide [Bacillus aquiflavi]MBA4538703.1 cyclic lactone autoinducer peptide [Bacillus aquiflavi]NEY83063.1 cyclic lactone autoinducer peptide [Bacillus aquiflavi]UAC48034.1 cyclic lactone autoinducer peptide [Bacillus aquiflavi]
MKFLASLLGFVALLTDKIATFNSCFWFAYEPTPPEKRQHLNVDKN